MPLGPKGSNTGTMASINEKIDRLQHEFRALSEEALKDDEARKKLLGVALEGMGTLETPVETIWRLIMTVSICGQKSPL